MVSEPAEKGREHEETAPAAGLDEPADAAAAESSTGTEASADTDDADDFEDLEFLLDDIEDQIAPLG